MRSAKTCATQSRSARKNGHSAAWVNESRNGRRDGCNTGSNVKNAQSLLPAYAKWKASDRRFAVERKLPAQRLNDIKGMMFSVNTVSSMYKHHPAYVIHPKIFHAGCSFFIMLALFQTSSELRPLQAAL